MSKTVTRSLWVALVLVLPLLISASEPLPARAETPSVQQWAQRFGVAGYNSYANAIAVDSAGNTWVTGYSSNGSNDDFVTIKYNSDGVQQWVQWYNHTGNGNDRAQDMAVDAAGNSYVVGWGRGAGTNDFITVKYSSSGTQLWAKAYDNSNRTAAAMAVALDGQGNPIVAGYGSTAANQDYITVKYAADGTQLWAKLYNGTGNGQDNAYAIASDAGGNAYVTGQSRGTGGNDDYATVKYSGADGTQLWAARYNGPDNINDWARSVAVDYGGNVIVAGYSYNSHDADYATIKYNGSSGAQLWAARYNCSVNRDDVSDINSLAVDSGGNAFVTGSSFNSDNKAIMCTVKYNTDGVQQWVAGYIGPANIYAYGFAIAVDAAGNAYATGQSGNGTNSDYATVKYGAAGTEQWAARYSGPFSPDCSDYASDIALNGSNVYVTGKSYNADGYRDYATVKYAQVPSLSSISPVTATQGQCPLTITITGANFTGATAVSFGAGINVGNFTVNSATSITATICIGESVPAGAYDVTVTTPGGTATLPGAFTVSAQPRQTAIGTGSHSSTLATAPPTQAPPVVNALIQPQSASLSATSAAPGTPVTLTVEIANKSATGGTKNIQVYVNGQLEAAKGVSLSGSGSTQVSFSIARSEPGSYNVYADGIPAGSFTVEAANGNDLVLWASTALLAIALISSMFMLSRRKGD